MTCEDKELLLRDICARLPYGVKVEYNNSTCEVLSIDKYNEELTIHITNIKPYLFPLSSMNEEQKRELRQLEAFVNTFGNICFETLDEYGHDIITTYEDAVCITDWLNKNHFDYRGLIPMGLALDATNLNIY